MLKSIHYIKNLILLTLMVIGVDLYAQPFISIDDILLCQKTNNGTINYQLTGLDASKTYNYKWTLFDITGDLHFTGQTDRDNVKIQGDKNINNGISFATLKVEVWEVGCTEDPNNNSEVATSCYNFKNVSVGYYTAPPITLSVDPYDSCIPSGGSQSATIRSTFDVANLPNNAAISPQWSIESTTGTTASALNDYQTAATNATNSGASELTLTVNNTAFDVGENEITITVKGVSSCGDTSNDESDIFVLTFYRTPEPSISGLVEICAISGQNLGEIITQTTDPFTYTWSINTITGGTVVFNGSGTNSSGLTITDIQFDPNTLFIDATFDVAVSGGVGSCPGSTFQIDVQFINSTLTDVTNPLEICLLDGTASIQIGNQNAIVSTGVNYSWSLSGITGGTLSVLGSGNNNSAVSLTGINFNTSSAVINATLDLTVTGVNTSCTTTSIPITINRQPDQLNLSDLILCALDGTSNVIGITEDANPIIGYTYTWSKVSVNNGSFDVTPSANGTGFNLDNINFNANQQQITGVAQLVVNTGNSCGDITVTIAITIDKIPSAINTIPSFICVDNNVSNIQIIAPNLSADIIAGFNYNWTYTLDTPTDGSLLLGTLGTDNSGIEFNSINFNTDVTELTGTINLTITGAVCAATSTSIPFTLYRRPDILNTNSVAVCSKDGNTLLNAITAHTDNFSGFNYVWSLSGLSGGTIGSISSNGNNNSGLALNTINFDFNSQQITGTINLTINGLDATCGNVMALPLTIDRSPDVLSNLIDFETCLLQNSTPNIDIISPYTEDYPTLSYSWLKQSENGGTVTLLPYGNDNSGLQITNVVFSTGSEVITGTVEVSVNGASVNCSTSPQTFNYIIHRLPDGLQVIDFASCQLNGATNLQVQAVNTDIITSYTYSWSILTTNGGTLTLASTGADGSGLLLNDINFTSGETEITAIIRGTVTGVAPSCASSTQDFNVTIYRVPDAINLTAQMFCLTNGVTTEIIAADQIENLNGYTYSWQILNETNGTINTSTFGTQNSGLNLDNVSFTGNNNTITATARLIVTGANASCGILQNDIPITIYRLPELSALTSAVTCAFNPDNNIEIIAPNIGNDIVNGTTYNWVVSGVTNGAVTINPIGTDGSGVEFTNISFTSNATSVSGNLEVTITGVNVACGSITNTIPFTVYRKPDQLSLTAINACISDGTVSYEAVVPNVDFFVGYSYDWTISGITGGTFGVLEKGNNNSGLDFTTIDFTTGSELITATLNLTINGLDVSCGNTLSIPITINRNPDALANLTDFEICILEGTTSIDVITPSTEDLPTISYSWSKIGIETGGSTGALVGYGNDNSGLRFSTINFDVTSDVISGTVQLTVSGLSGACATSTATFNYTLHRLPDGLEIIDTEICETDGATNVSLFPVNAEIINTYNYTWSISNISGGSVTVQGTGADNSGVLLNDINFSTNSTLITATLTGTVNGMDASCTGATKDVTITINRLPDALSLSAQTYCLSDGAVSETIAAEQGETLTGYTYNWSTTVTGGTIGTSTFGTQNSGLSLSTVTFNAGSSQITGTATITVTGAAGSCGTLSTTFPITINRLPDTLALSSVDFCLLNATTDQSIFTENATAINDFTYNWSFVSISGGTIDLDVKGTDQSGLEFDNIIFTGASNQIVGTLQLSVTSASALCTIPSISIPVTIDRIPDMTRYASALEFCKYTNDTDHVIYTEEPTLINNFNYTWNTANVIGGSIVLDPSGNNNSALEFDNIIFDPASTVITGDLIVTVAIPNASCGTFTQTVPFTIHLIPEIVKISDYSISLCSFTANDDELVDSGNSTALNNYTYNWSFSVAPSGGTFNLPTPPTDHNKTDQSDLNFYDINFDASSTVITATLRLTITNLDAICGFTEKLIPVRIDLEADDINLAPQALCEFDGQTNVIAYAENVSSLAGVTSTWSLSGTSGGSILGLTQYGVIDSGLLFDQIDFADGSDEITGTITLLQETPDCVDKAASTTFSIKRKIDSSTYTSLKLCSFNDNGTLVGYSPITENIANTTYSWAKDGNPQIGGTFDIVTTGSNNSGVNISNIAFTTNSSIISGNLVYTVTTDCNTETKTIPITIERKVDITSLSFIDLCVINGATNQTLLAEISENIPGFTYSWGAVNIINGGTFTLNSFGNNASGLTADNINFGSNQNQIIAEVTLTVGGSCDASSITIPIEINRLPDVSSISDATICAIQDTDNEMVIVPSTETLSGINYTWSIQGGSLSGGTITLRPNGNNNSGLIIDDIHFDDTIAPSSAQLSCIIDVTISGGCTPVTTSFNLIIDRAVDMSVFTAAYDICELDGETNVSLVSPLAETVTGLDYVWSVVSISGGTFTLFAQGTDNSGLQINDITFDNTINPSSADINAVLRVQNTNGCSVESKDITLHIGRRPSIVNVNNFEICLPTTATNEIVVTEFSELVSGFTYNWSYDKTTFIGGEADFSGYGNNSSGLQLDNLIFNTNSTTITGTVLLTVANSCGPYPHTVSFTIHREPDLSSWAFTTLCATDNNDTGILISGITETLTDWNYTWQLDAGSLNGGTFTILPNGNQDSELTAENINFDDNSAQITANITLTVSTTSCNDITTTLPVIINRKVDLNAINLNTLCVVDGATNQEVLTGISETIPGFNYTWGVLTNSTGGSFSVSSAGNNNSQLVINSIDFNDNSLGITADITLTVAGSCDNSTVTKQININRIPDLSIFTNQNLCVLQNSVSEVIFTPSTEMLTDVNYSWSVSGASINGGNFSLLPNGSNNSGLTLENIIFDNTSDLITATIDVTVTGGCKDVSTSFNLILDRKVNMDLFPTSLTMCELEGTTGLQVINNLTETVNNLSYTWEVITGSSTGGTFLIESTGADNSGLVFNTIDFDISSNVITAQLRVINTTGCSLESKTIPVTISRMPEATTLTQVDVCLPNGTTAYIAIPENVEAVTDFIYTWNVINQNGGSVTFSQNGNNLSELVFDNVTFATGATQITGTITLNVANACGNYPLNLPLTINRSIAPSSINLLDVCALDNDPNNFEVYAGTKETLPGFNYVWQLNASTVTGGSFNINQKGIQNSGLDISTINFDDGSIQIIGTATLTVSGTCTTFSETYPITINRKVDTNAITLTTLCVVNGATNQELLAALTETIPGFTYTWGTAPVNLNGGAFSTVSSGNSNSGLTANTISFDNNSLLITGEISLQVAGDCDFQTVQVPIQINRIPDISTYSNQLLCLLEGATNENIITASTELLTGVGYTWSIQNNSLIGGTIVLSPYGNNNSGLALDNVDFDTNSKVLSFTVDVTTTGGCQAQATSFDIIINRKIDMSLFPDQIDICQLEGAKNVEVFTGLSEIINTIDYTWEVIPATTIGGTFSILAQGTDNSGLLLNSINFDLSSSQIKATLRVKNNSGCNLETKDIPLIIGRMPEATTAPSVDVCLSDGQNGYIAISGNTEAIMGYVYTWSIINLNGGSLTVAQQGNNQSELIFNDVNFDDGSTEITGTIQLDVAGACGNYPLNLPLTITRTIEPTDIVLSTLCAFDEEGNNYELYNGLTETINTWNYVWSLDNTSLSGGTFDIITKGNQLSGIDATNINFNDGSDLITAQVTLSISGTCSNVVQTYPITINRKVSLAPIVDFEECVDGVNSITIFTPNSDPLASINYSWATSVTGGSFIISPNGVDQSGLTLNNVTFAAGSSIIDGTITVAQTGSCLDDTKTINIRLSRSAEYSTTHLFTICSEAIMNLTGIVSEELLFDLNWNIVSISGANTTGLAKLTTFNGSTSNTLNGISVNNNDFDNGSGLITMVIALNSTNKLFPTCLATQEYTINFTRIPEIIIPDATAEGCSAVPVIIYPFGTEDFSADYLYNWQLVGGSINGASTTGINHITSIINNFVDQNLAVTLNDTDYLNIGTQQITFDVDVTVSNKNKQDCTGAASTKRYSFTIHRSPLVGLPTARQESCETGSLTLNSSFAQQSNISYSWQILNTVGGTLSGSSNSAFYYTVSGPVFNTDTYEMTADVVLTTVNNAMPNVCPGIDTVQVYFQRIPSPDFSLVQAIGCARQDVVFDASKSGIPSGTSTYEWDFNYLGTFTADASTTDTQITKEFIGEGNYEIALRITSSLGCTSTIVSKSITIHPTPTANFTIPSLICVDEEFKLDGTSSTSGNPNAIANWEWYFDYTNNQNTASITGNNLAKHKYSKEGIYDIALVITNNLGCQDTLQKQVEVINVPQTTFKPQVYICNGQTVKLEINGGVRWEWEDGQTTNTISVSPTITRFYKVTSFNKRDCPTIDSLEVIVLPNGSGSSTEVACEFSNVELQSIVSDRGVIKGIEWDTGETTLSITVNKAGKYSYKLWVQANENAEACLYEHTINLIMNPLPETIMPTDTTFCFDDDATIDITATNNANYAIVWQNGNETTSTLTIDEEGTYTVVMTDLSNDTHCTEEFDINIVELCPPKITPPTAFTPNGDGLNDTFFIEGKDLRNINLTIYNRWGEIIFYKEYADETELRDPTLGWDGYYRGTKVPVGDYIYIIIYENELYPGKTFKKENGISVVY
ncbi:T9SS type B sorting domain-containing protein [Flammeovirga pectinis]|uniref:T9SS type B sorting domain-containing protein n=1 Tax=Flammeovirga pectinis TaxID=2494373 RepID=A0A3S9PAW3_9BACT|nr:gliding motility-associated C-terminal domain-containing protein [Flammeovirga pectinis]AZQ65344.1 T9SS type B sorting domain-containing protein [Flammeovirga pectinis]